MIACTCWCTTLGRRGGGAGDARRPRVGQDVALNVLGVFRLTRELLPALTRGASATDPSRVIIIGSIAGIRPQKYPTFSYDASKAAAHHLARKLAGQIASNENCPSPSTSSPPDTCRPR